VAVPLAGNLIALLPLSSIIPDTVSLIARVYPAAFL